MSDRVLTYLYQFGIGAAVYVLTIVVLWRAGAMGEDPRRRRAWLILLIVGFLVYAVGQGLLQFLGPEYDISVAGATPGAGG